MPPSSAALLLLLRRPAAGPLVLLRRMGGGPRTFPGGLSKWKYRRMHEKLAREKERRLLNQEKGLYLARLRSELRSRAAFGDSALWPSSPGGRWMSSGEHVKALADRFVRDGAEDLWNDDDGPALPVRPRGPSPPPRTADAEGRNGFLDETDRNAWKQIESFYRCRDDANSQHRLFPLDPSLQTSPSPSGSQSPYPKVLEFGLRSSAGDGHKTSFHKVGSFHQRREYSVHAGRHKASSKYGSKKRLDSGSESDYGYGMDIMHQGNVGLDRVLFRNKVLGKELEEPISAVGKLSKSKIMNEAVFGAKDHIYIMRTAHSREIENVNILQEIHYIRDELEKRRAPGEIERNKVVPKILFSERRLCSPRFNHDFFLLEVL